MLSEVSEDISGSSGDFDIDETADGPIAAPSAAPQAVESVAAATGETESSLVPTALNAASAISAPPGGDVLLPLRDLRSLKASSLAARCGISRVSDAGTGRIAHMGSSDWVSLSPIGRSVSTSDAKSLEALCASLVARSAGIEGLGCDSCGDVSAHASSPPLAVPGAGPGTNPGASWRTGRVVSSRYCGHWGEVRHLEVVALTPPGSGGVRNGSSLRASLRDAITSSLRRAEEAMDEAEPPKLHTGSDGAAAASAGRTVALQSGGGRGGPASARSAPAQPTTLSPASPSLRRVTTASLDAMDSHLMLSLLGRNLGATAARRAAVQIPGGHSTGRSAESSLRDLTSLTVDELQSILHTEGMRAVETTTTLIAFAEVGSASSTGSAVTIVNGGDVGSCPALPEGKFSTVTGAEIGQCGVESVGSLGEAGGEPAPMPAGRFVTVGDGASPASADGRPARLLSPAHLRLIKSVARQRSRDE